MRAAVIGGGLAGLVAALELLERGHQVTLLERRGVLGGRATSYTDAATGDAVDTGTHVLFPGCRETLRLLRRCDAWDVVRHDVAPPRGADRAALLRLLLNEIPERVAASVVRAVDAELLGAEPGPRPLLFRAGVGGLAACLGDRIRSLGGVVRMRALAERLDVRGRRVRGVRVVQRAPTREAIRAGHRAVGETIEADVVIAAVPWHALPGLLDDRPPGEPVVAAAAAVEPRPCVSIEAWTEAPPLPQPLTPLARGPIEWAVDKAALADRRGPLRQLAFVVRPGCRAEPRSNAEWADAAAAAFAEALAPRPAPALQRVLVLREPAAFFGCEDAANGRRPVAASGIEGLLLAGDWTATGLPACLEGAVRSGIRAAAAAVPRTAAAGSRS